MPCVVLKLGLLPTKITHCSHKIETINDKIKFVVFFNPSLNEPLHAAICNPYN